MFVLHGRLCALIWQQVLCGLSRRRRNGNLRRRARDWILVDLVAIFIRHLLQLVGLPSPPHWHADIRGRVESLKPAPGKDQVTAPSRLKADPVGPGREDKGTGSVAG